VLLPSTKRRCIHHPDHFIFSFSAHDIIQTPFHYLILGSRTIRLVSVK